MTAEIIRCLLKRLKVFVPSVSDYLHSQTMTESCRENTNPAPSSRTHNFLQPPSSSPEALPFIYFFNVPPLVLIYPQSHKKTKQNVWFVTKCFFFTSHVDPLWYKPWSGPHLKRICSSPAGVTVPVSSLSTAMCDVKRAHGQGSESTLNCSFPNDDVLVGGEVNMSSWSRRAASWHAADVHLFLLSDLVWIKPIQTRPASPQGYNIR